MPSANSGQGVQALPGARLRRSVFGDRATTSRHFDAIEWTGSLGVGEQSIERASNDSIALARRALERRTIEHSYDAPVVLDGAYSAQGKSGFGDARTSNAEHLREHVMGELEFVALDAIVRHEQPARAALQHRVLAVASRVLADESEQPNRISVK
jgi:hypothetical protein